jgi:hypothetical protein
MGLLLRAWEGQHRQMRRKGHGRMLLGKPIDQLLQPLLLGQKLAIKLLEPDYLSSQTSSRRAALKMLLVFTIAPLTFGRMHVPRSA